MPKRILVIEDEKEISLIMRMRLESRGYEVLQAFDGEEGLVRAKKESPDLILLDLVLPKLAGTEILDELKKSYHHRDIPVIIVTGLVRDSLEGRAIVDKADAYFLKPYDTIELLTTIDDVLKGS